MKCRLADKNKLISTLFMGVLIFLGACQGNQERSDAYGNFEADEVVVSAETQGPLQNFDSEEGSRVKSGETVALVDTVLLSIDLERALTGRRAAEAGLEQLRKNIDVQKTRLEVLHREVERVSNLYEDEAISTRKYDEVTGEYDVARKELEHLRSRRQGLREEINLAGQKVKAAREKLKRCSVKAPRNGVILQKYAEKGELVTPGKPLFKMAETNELILRAYISGDQLDDVKTGQEVTVKYDRDQQSEHSTTGRVTWISPSAEFTPKIIQTKEERVDLVYAIKVRVPNPEGEMKIGMPGEVVF